MYSKKEWVTSDLWNLSHITDVTSNCLERFHKFKHDMQTIADKNNVTCNLDEDEYISAINQMRVDNFHELQEINIMANINLHFTTLIPLEYSAMQKLVGDNINLFNLEKTTSGQCPMLHYISIRIDGSVMPCCRAPLSKQEYEATAIGKISLDTPLPMVLQSPKYRTMLKAFRENKVIAPGCKDCMGKYVKKIQ